MDNGGFFHLTVSSMLQLHLGAQLRSKADTDTDTTMPRSIENVSGAASGVTSPIMDGGEPGIALIVGTPGTPK